MKTKRLPISSELVFNLLRGTHPGYFVTKNEIPADAKLINVRHSWPDSVELLIWSDTFEDVPDGEEIPYFVPEFQSIQSLTLCRNPEHIHDYASGSDCLK